MKVNKSLEFKNAVVEYNEEEERLELRELDKEGEVLHFVENIIEAIEGEVAQMINKGKFNLKLSITSEENQVEA